MFFVILNLESSNGILFNMNMKKMLFLVAAIVMASASVWAATFVAEPGIIELTLYEKNKTTTSFNVISTRGFEKELSIDSLPDWISCQPKTFLINKTTSPTIKVDIDASKLEPGQHQTEIQIKTASSRDALERISLPVTIHVLPESDKPTATPRSIDIKPGLVRIIVINNPSKTNMSFNVKSSAFWIQTYPDIVDVPAQGSNLIWVKMTASHFAGGVYPSTLTVSSDIASFDIPIKAVVSSGIEFNPESITDSGSITMTNKLKNTVIVKPANIAGVEFSAASASIPPGKSKIINIKFTGDTKPDYITFDIFNGTNKAHNIKVNK